MYDPERKYSTKYPALHKNITTGIPHAGLDQFHEFLIFATRVLVGWNTSTHGKGFTPEEAQTMLNEVRDIRADIAHSSDQLRSIERAYLEIEQSLINTHSVEEPSSSSGPIR
jgi:hypothetical protein